MVMELRLGDVVRLKKKHPCGSYEWQVVRIGADIRIKCLKCHHLVLMARSTLERRVKGFISRGGREGQEASLAERRRELESRLADLRGRWPADAVPLSVWHEMEELQEELGEIEGEASAKD